MTERLAGLLAEAAETGGPVMLPGPGLRDRARRRHRRRQAGTVAGSVLAVVVVVAVALAGARLSNPSRQPPVTYARTGPGSVAALAAGRWEQLPAAPIAGRVDPVAVWTGAWLLVWGGTDPRTGAGYGDGAAYDPVARRWERLPASPLRARAAPKGVWTGSELLVWGGPQASSSRDVALPSMAAYSPTTRVWRVLPGPPHALSNPAVVWDGRRLVVVGIEAPSLSLRPGPAPPVRARAMVLDPVASRWAELPDPPLTHLGGTRLLQAVATDRGVYVLATWSVQEQIGPGAYTGRAGQEAVELDGSTWRKAPAPAAPTPPLWTGRELLSPAGRPPTAGMGGPLSTHFRGQRLEPGGQWRPIAAGPVDSLLGTSTWTGAALVTAGTTTATADAGGQVLPGAGAAWDPVTDRWASLPAAPLVGDRAVQVWTGNQLLQWGLLHRPTPLGFKGMVPEQQDLIALVPAASTPDAHPSAEPGPSAFAGQRVSRNFTLPDGISVQPDNGQRPAYPRQAALADYRSAVIQHWANTSDTDVREYVGHGLVTRSGAGQPQLTAVPAWVVLYRTSGGPYSCPMMTAAPEPPASDAERWHLFVLPDDGTQAFVWHGRGTGGCGRLSAPQVEPALRHYSAAWTEIARSGTTVTVQVQAPCFGEIAQVAGVGSDGRLQVVTTQPLTTRLVSCPRATLQTTAPISRPDQHLVHATVGLLGTGGRRA